MPSVFLALAERLSGRQTSSLCVNGMLVDMERVKMPLPDGPPPQTPLTKRAKLSGQIAAQMERQQQGQQSVSQLGSVPMSDPPDRLQSSSPVLSPITGIGVSQFSSIPDTPSPLRQATAANPAPRVCCFRAGLVRLQPTPQAWCSRPLPRSTRWRLLLSSSSRCFGESKSKMP